VLEQSLDPYDQVKTLVVGNLPYYITSPIFRKFFEDHQFTGGVFLIQKEVAEKIMTNAHKKSYLRWLLNNHYEIDYCFTVPA
jgi:16S rRNA (adenine1518-N6/adenine1519-N6)-dimethyltransferase